MSKIQIQIGESMRKPEVIKPLKIALLAWNCEQSKYAMRDFIENNKDQIDTFHENKVILNDGTEIFIVNYIKDIRGKNFDQVMICDDYRWNIYIEKSYLIREIILEIGWKSCVPEEFLVMRYEF